MKFTAKQEGKLTVGFDIEGAHAIDDIDLISLFYDLGVGWMLMTYNKDNQTYQVLRQYWRGCLPE